MQGNTEENSPDVVARTPFGKDVILERVPNTRLFRFKMAGDLPRVLRGSFTSHQEALNALALWDKARPADHGDKGKKAASERAEGKSEKGK